MCGFVVLVVMVLMKQTEGMVLSGRSRLLKSYEPSLYSESESFSSDNDNSKIQRQQQRMRQNDEAFHHLFNKKSTQPSTRKEKQSHKDRTFGNSNSDDDLNKIQQNLLKHYGETFPTAKLVELFSDISDQHFLEQFSGDLTKTPSPNSKYKSSFRSDIYPNIMPARAPVKKGFCRLLCATCEDKASRRWSILCGSQCESGGIAYNVCLMVYRNIDGNTRPA